MPFKISLMTDNLPEPAAFRAFWFNDENRLARTSKKRRISVPNKGMRLIHARMISQLRSVVLPYGLMKAATGCRRNNSPRRTAQIHSRHRYFFTTDIHSAYPSLDGRKLTSILQEIFELPDEYGQLDLFLEILPVFVEKYFLDENGGLRIGGPASPDLFNLYAAVVLDKPLRVLCQKYNLTYTRYLDDLVFSADEPIGDKKRQAIRRVIAESGFQISHRKSQVVDLKKRPIEINGIGLAWPGRIFLPRHFLAKIRGLIYRASTKGDVPPEKVYGYMGVFRSVSGKNGPFNKTERKVFRLYNDYRRLLSGLVQ